MTVSPIPRRQAQTIEFHLGSSPAVPTDGGFEATLVMTPGGLPRVRLTQLGWGVGVGWYAQQTLELDLNEAHQLAALLDRAPRTTEQLPDVEPAVGGPTPPERAPIDLAMVRARRPRQRRRMTPSAVGRADTALASIARRHETVATREETADP